MTGFDANKELLLPFEQKNIPEHYLPYFIAKRTNFIASVQGSRNLWRYYLLLDEILFTELRDMSTTHDPDRLFPLALLCNAHAKIRVSGELAFAKCMEEARSILRDAIETAVYAHYMHDDPKLQRIWLSNDDSPQATIDFKEAFEKDKKNRSFEGLPILYARWGYLCEIGSHSTPQAIVSRFKIAESEKDIKYLLNYTGVEDRDWEPETFMLLQITSMIEEVIFSDYRARLQFDENLLRHRSLAKDLGDQVRREIIEKHNIPPPTTKSASR